MAAVQLKQRLLSVYIEIMLKQSESTETLFTDSDRINGDTRSKKQSTTESVYSRTKYSDFDDDDDR